MPSVNPLDYTAAEHAQAEAEKRDRLAAEIEIDDLKWLMSNKRGRRFMRLLLDRAGVWRLSFNTNALAMAFAEGQRNEGLRQVGMLNEHCPERYAEMLKESKE